MQTVAKSCCNFFCVFVMYVHPVGINYKSGELTMSQSFKFKPALLSVAVAGAITSSAVAVAQEQVMEEVTVVGIRASLMRAQAVKMDSTSIVEAISAEDIGKLPDSSIAESLARVPGLAGERRGGRTSGISVRGFKEDFVGTTMNGRELLGIGDNRGVEFDLYPSEIMTGAVVYKSADASLGVQGIGGTVDLRTARPLEVDPTITVNYSFETNSLSSPNPDYDTDGSRVAVSFIEQFADDTIGIALAYADTESPLHTRNFGVWGYSQREQDGQTAYAPDGYQVFARSRVLERETISAVLQFRPNDQLDIVIDSLNIDFSDSGIERGFIEGMTCCTGWTGTSTDGTVWTTGTTTGWNATQFNRPLNKLGELDQYGVNIKYQASEDLEIRFDASSSETSKVDYLGESYAGLGRSGTVAGDQPIIRSWTMTPNGLVFGGGDARHSDPNQLVMAGTQSWGGAMGPFAQVQNLVSSFYSAYPNTGDANGDGIEDSHGLYYVNAAGQGSISYINAQDGFNNEALFAEQLDTMRLEGIWNLNAGIFTQLNAGVMYSERDKVKDNNGYFVTSTEFVATAANPNGGLSVAPYYVGQTDLTWAGLGTVAAYDVDAVYADGKYFLSDASLTETDRIGDSYSLNEKITTYFAKGDFETEVGGLSVTGNVGVQIVDTEQTSFGNDAYAGSDGFVVKPEVMAGDSYTKVLPSLNININLSEEEIVRIAMGKSLSRARFDYLRPGKVIKYEYNVSQAIETEDPLKGPWSARSGNPKLRPYESNNFDVTYENYFADDGYFALSVWYKDLVNWHRDGVEIVDFTQYYVPTLHRAADSAGNFYQPQLFVGRSDIREDGLTGDVNGVELTANIPLRVLSDSLDGFGIVASAAFNDGGLDDGGQIPGMSDEVYQLTAYYENNGFEVRVSATDRSGFETEQRGGSNSIATAYRQPIQLIDAQISYDFAESGIEYLEGLRVSLQAMNITEENDVNTLADSSLLVTGADTYGSTTMLNLNWSF